MCHQALSEGSLDTENAAQALDFFGTLQGTEDAHHQLSEDHELERSDDDVKSKCRKLEETSEIKGKKKKRRRDPTPGEVMLFIWHFFH